jgi:hypothetical protein
LLRKSLERTSIKNTIEIRCSVFRILVGSMVSVPEIFCDKATRNDYNKRLKHTSDISEIKRIIDRQMIVQYMHQLICNLWVGNWTSLVIWEGQIDDDY